MSHWDIHVTYGLKSFGVRELACVAMAGRELGKLREIERVAARDTQLTGHSTHWMVVGAPTPERRLWAPRTVSAIVGMKRASTDSCHSIMLTESS